MADSTKVSFSLDNGLLQEVTRLTKKQPKQNQTQVLNTLIHQGLYAERELDRLKHREDYVLLKTLHMMRVLAGSRGEEFLQETDAKFQEQLAEMKEMIYEEGMDYSNG